MTKAKIFLFPENGIFFQLILCLPYIDLATDETMNPSSLSVLFLVAQGAFPLNCNKNKYKIFMITNKPN